MFSIVVVAVLINIGPRSVLARSRNQRGAPRKAIVESFLNLEGSGSMAIAKAEASRGLVSGQYGFVVTD